VGDNKDITPITSREVQSQDGKIRFSVAKRMTTADWNPVSVQPESTYLFAITVRSSSNLREGFYVRVIEDSGTESRWHLWDVRQKAKTYVIEYEPNEGAQVITIRLKRRHDVTATITVDSFGVYRVASRHHWLPRWLTNTMNGRDLIWASSIEKTNESPFIGLGISTDERIVSTNMRRYEHPHSILTSTYHYGGLLAVILLICLIASSASGSNVLARTELWIIASSLLVYSLVALSFDGNQLLTKVDQTWVTFWLSLAILAALQSVGAKSRLSAFPRNSVEPNV